MRFLPHLVCAIAFISVLSQFGKTLLGLAGVPNVIPVFRDLTLVCLGLWAVARTDFFRSRTFFAAILVSFIVIVINIIVAMFQGRHFAGVYYARLYALPLVFAVACHGWLLTSTDEQAESLVRFILRCVTVLLLAAIVIFMAVEFKPNLLNTLMGGERGPLAAAWYIAGATWLRMGLPATGPNSLGMIFALVWLLLLTITLSPIKQLSPNRRLPFLLIGSMFVLLLTFSRSSWLAAVAGSVVLVASCFKAWRLHRILTPLRVFAFASVSLVVLIAAGLYIDDYSNGALTRWVSLNLTGSDPSMIGHTRSFAIALSQIEEYYLIGYPRGSVGPKALLFGGGMYNVENSFLGIIYDVGIPVGVLLMAMFILTLRGMWRHRCQLAAAAAFGLASFFLPYAFEADMVIFFFMTYAMLGRIGMLEKGRSAASAEQRNAPPICAYPVSG